MSWGRASLPATQMSLAASGPDGLLGIASGLFGFWPLQELWRCLERTPSDSETLSDTLRDSPRLSETLDTVAGATTFWLGSFSLVAGLSILRNNCDADANAKYAQYASEHLRARLESAVWRSVNQSSSLIGPENSRLPF